MPLCVRHQMETLNCDFPFREHENMYATNLPLAAVRVSCTFLCKPYNS